MPYPGVPEELTSKMDRCVKKVMKNGKNKDEAIAICKTSITNQKIPEKKEEPREIVASKTNHLFFSNSEFSKENKMDSSKEGKLLKNVEIFKAGTYKGVQFKPSALDKMVANFYYLKAFNKFPNVPVRADHPGMFGLGDVIDKVGGYIEDLRRVGNKLVADFRITSESMWEKVQEGSYISRSAEIGSYDDNDGVIYSPTLFGVAWVDIPAVEGLSPKFSFSKDRNLIKLNSIPMDKEKKDLSKEAEGKESEKDLKPSTPEKKVELEKEEKVETPEKTTKKLDKNDQVESLSFAKQFPKEAEELEKYRLEVLSNFFGKLVSEGKLAPASEEKCLEFAKTLSNESLESFKKILSSFPVAVKLDKEEIEEEEGEVEKDNDKNEEEETDKKADEFIKETN
jgi:hypothetical protein